MNIPLYIQYDSKKYTDGFGAQGLRIVGVYTVAKAFKLKYLHQGISEISDRVELTGPDGDEPKYRQVLEEMNQFLAFDSHADLTNLKLSRTVFIHNLGFRILFKYIVLSFLRPNQYLLKVLLPFGIVDRFPILYRFSRKDIQCIISKRKRGSRKIGNVAHVRGSEHSPDKMRPQLGPSYFEELIFSGRYPCLPGRGWIIHTDFYSSDFSQTIKTERSRKFVSLFERFRKDEIFTVNHYASIGTVFSDMVHADLLIMSRSALSYLAGIFCVGEVVYPSIHGHAKLPGWKVEIPK